MPNLTEGAVFRLDRDHWRILEDLHGRWWRYLHVCRKLRRFVDPCRHEGLPTDDGVDDVGSACM